MDRTKSLVKTKMVPVKVNELDAADLELAIQYESERLRAKVYAARLLHEIAMPRIRELADLERRRLGLPLPHRIAA